MKILSDNVKNAVKTLKCFDSLAQLYWLNAMVELDQLTKTEAGYIIFNRLI